MINKDTIISAYDEKLTLVQWLKLVNKALDEAVLTNVEIAQRGNATFVFVFTFEDGTQVESNEIIVNQGESIVGATIQNGHLLLTLSNDDVLDAGNVKPVSSFSINNNQHLIVHYGDGTTQDLGAIFQGNISIDGLLEATTIKANSIVENMSGYSFLKVESDLDWACDYASVVKNGNKLTFVVFGSINYSDTEPNASSLAKFNIPSNVGEKLIPYTISGWNSVILQAKVPFFNSISTYKDVIFEVNKNSNAQITINFPIIRNSNLSINTTYLFRIEFTFLLTDNMAV